MKTPASYTDILRAVEDAFRTKNLEWDESDIILGRVLPFLRSPAGRKKELKEVLVLDSKFAFTTDTGVEEKLFVIHRSKLDKASFVQTETLVPCLTPTKRYGCCTPPT